MITNNISTLKIHKLTQAQYDRELAAGNIDETALYLTPDETPDNIQFQLDNKADKIDGVYKRQLTLPAGSTSVAFSGFYTEGLTLVNYVAYIGESPDDLLILDTTSANNLTFSIAEAYDKDIIIDVFFKG